MTPTQARLVLEMLQSAGERGVHSVLIRRAYVANPSQRILELEKRGHVITKDREKSPFGPSMGVRYRLVSSPQRIAEAPVVEPVQMSLEDAA